MKPREYSLSILLCGPAAVLGAVSENLWDLYGPLVVVSLAIVAYAISPGVRKNAEASAKKYLLPAVAFFVGVCLGGVIAALVTIAGCFGYFVVEFLLRRRRDGDERSAKAPSMDNMDE